VELPKQRISGRALRAIVTAVRRTPATRLLARLLRAELGIDALRALGADARGPLATDLAPLRARANRTRVSQNLGIAVRGDWPRTSAAYADAYRENRVTPEQVATRAFAAARELASRKPSLGPFVAYDEERALRSARESSARIRAGTPRGLLDGVPIAIKEEVDVAGLPTRLGTGFLPSTPAAVDSTVVARLRAAGAVILGQTAMTEYGMSPLGGNVHREMPRNAHDPARLPGGSSSGSGVAVAVGLCPAALGADGGGSIRIPAALNGVFGLKPTFGRLPLVGLGLNGGSSVVHLGPLAASCHDLAVFTQVTAGSDERDRASIAQPPYAAQELVNALGHGVRGLRIGVDHDEWAAADADVARIARDALGALERAGAVLVDVKLRLAKHAAAVGYLTIGLEMFSVLYDVRQQHMDELGLDLQLMFTQFESFRPDDYLDAQRVRSMLRVELAELLRDVDVLALPTTASVAPPVTDSEARGGFVDPTALAAMCRFAFLGNLTGVPAGSAPVGLGSHELPVGLQIVGDAWDEATVLAVLAELERSGAAVARRPAAHVDLLA
jgi:aspartyl-tRNA(Asn)/glutamyl-tRNA(Gln) amidotransferase subunit A